MKKRFKNAKNMVKASVAKAIKKSNIKHEYWNTLIARIPTPTRFDIFWKRFQIWKSQNQ